MPFVIKQPRELNKEINNGKFYHHMEDGTLRQCSEPSSPSVLEVGPDGPTGGSPSFFESMDDYGKWGWDLIPYGAP